MLAHCFTAEAAENAERIEKSLRALRQRKGISTKGEDYLETVVEEVRT